MQPSEVFYKKAALKFRNIHEKTPVLESLVPATLLKWASCEYREIFKNTYLEKHLGTADFEVT